MFPQRYFSNSLPRIGALFGAGVGSRATPVFFSVLTLGEDAMIAATARIHGLTVATRNERACAHFNVAVLNPSK